MLLPAHAFSNAIRYGHIDLITQLENCGFLNKSLTCIFKNTSLRIKVLKDDGLTLFRLQSNSFIHIMCIDAHRNAFDSKT